MIVPEKENKVKSIRIPNFIFKSFAFILVLIIFTIGILLYDYSNILNHVYENDHLISENRQLKEQIQLFQMKINSLGEDFERIRIFENKLKIITGVENKDDDQLKRPYVAPENLQTLLQTERIVNEKDYLNLKSLYDKKIANIFGLQNSYSYAQNWSKLIKQSFTLSKEYALFDHKFNIIKSFTKKLETSIHQLDQYLLDKDSFIKSTPSIMPTKGWVTSYFGPRHSPYSGRMRMHEGLDIGAPTGTPVLAPADGIITFSGKKYGFGNYIQIDHGYGVETIYGHNKKCIKKLGQKVQRGDLIALLGNTGISTGPHLHYEVRVNGTAVDPLFFTLDRY